MIVSTQALSKRYGSIAAVDNLDLTIEQGRPVALIGPNGAGKTTLLSLMCGFIRPSSGQISVFGQLPGHSSLHGQLAALPQDAQLDPRITVGRQLVLFARLLGMSRSQAGREVERVLDLVQLPETRTMKPDQLSHGMRKRVAIAQMMLGTPKLALLDEPTAGLDPPNARIIRDIVLQSSDNTTFVISSHNLEELEKVCETVVFLTQGRLERQGLIDSMDVADGAFLSIRVPDVEPTQFCEAVQSLEGVVVCKSTTSNEFIIEYQPESTTTPVDIQLLSLLHRQGWRYRQLSVGRSLEDKLFQHNRT